jgi:alcohol dehydrogenase YqhD (iron-dependent ADH family)
LKFEGVAREIIGVRHAWALHRMEHEIAVKYKV